MQETGGTAGKRRPDWKAIRAEYESRQFTPASICDRHRVTPAQLRYRRECEDWVSLKARPPRRVGLVARMLRVLEAQVRELEKATDMTIEIKTKVLAEQVRTMDKLIEKGAAERNVEPPTRKDMTALRTKLIKRLEQSSR